MTAHTHINLYSLYQDFKAVLTATPPTLGKVFKAAEGRGIIDESLGRVNKHTIFCSKCATVLTKRYNLPFIQETNNTDHTVCPACHARLFATLNFMDQIPFEYPNPKVFKENNRMTINNMWFLKKTVKRKMDFHNPHADAYNIAKCRQILVEYVAQNPHPLYPVLTPR